MLRKQYDFFRGSDVISRLFALVLLLALLVPVSQQVQAECHSKATLSTRFLFHCQDRFLIAFFRVFADCRLIEGS